MGKSLEIGQSMNIGNRGYVTGIDTHSIVSEDIHKIYEIEQDMWSHGLGSYIRCDDCEGISSKHDVFGYIEKHIFTQTVADIERLLGIGVPNCPKCRSDETHHVFDEQYRDHDISKRYEFSDSFLTVYKDMSGQIRGFVNAYVSNFDTIYQKEFDPFYSGGTKQKITHRIADHFDGDFPEQFIALNNIGAEQSCVSMTLLYQLLKHICYNIVENHEGVPSIFDSILGNTTHGLYNVIGGQRLYVTDRLNTDVVHQDFPTDIMFQKNAPEQTLETLGGGALQFFKTHKDTIKNFVKA